MEARVAFVLSRIGQTAKVNRRRDEMKTMMVLLVFAPVVILVAFWLRNIEEKTLAVLFLLYLLVVVALYLF
jgi:hypothetical protein